MNAPLHPIRSDHDVSNARLPRLEVALRLHLGQGIELDSGNDEALQVHALRLREAVGEPYELSLVVATSCTDPDVSAWLGAAAEVELGRGPIRRMLCGVVLRAEERRRDAHALELALSIGPTASLAAHALHQRTFHARDAVDIATSVLAASGAAAGVSLEIDANGLAARPPARDLRVQYGESDLRFVTRILAEEGIFMAFECDGARERIVLVDEGATPHAVESLDDDGELVCAPLRWRARVDAEAAGECVLRLAGASAVRTAQVVCTAADWTTRPVATLVDGATTGLPAAAGVWELHEPRRPPETAAGIVDPTRACARAHALDLTRAALGRVGESNALDLRAGARFELAGHPDVGCDRGYRVCEVVHEASWGSTDPGGALTAGARYHNRFTAVPDHVPLCPMPLAAPRIAGSHAAIVVGPAGEEIHTDRFGRVAVRMAWDRGDGGLADDTCWVRVMQPWAGASLGTVFIPRVGTEVVVSFVGGDPERPLVLGCVYDGAHDPPYALPEHKTRTVLRTASSPGGDGFNEISFEDAKGHEELYLHAQRNLRERVRAAHSVTVGASQSTTIGADRTARVGGSASETIGGWSEQHVLGGRFTRVLGGAGPAGDERSGFGWFSGDTLEVDGYVLTAATKQLELRGGTPLGTAPVARLTMNAQRVSLGQDPGKAAASVQMHDGIAEVNAAHAIVWRVGGNEIRLDGAGLKITLDAGARFDVRVSDGARFFVDQGITGVGAGAVVFTQGDSCLFLVDDGARLSGSDVSVHASSMATVRGDAHCTVGAEGTVHVKGAVSTLEGAAVRVVDEAGGAIEITGGIIRLN